MFANTLHLLVMQFRWFVKGVDIDNPLGPFATCLGTRSKSRVHSPAFVYGLAFAIHRLKGSTPLLKRSWAGWVCRYIVIISLGQGRSSC